MAKWESQGARRDDVALHRGRMPLWHVIHGEATMVWQCETTGARGVTCNKSCKVQDQKREMTKIKKLILVLQDMRM